MNIDFNKYFNLAKLNAKQQAFVINAVTDLVLARLTDMISEHLSESEIKELEAAGHSSNPEAVIGWLNKHVPNFAQGIDEILKEESAQLANQISALSNYALEG